MSIFMVFITAIVLAGCAASAPNTRTAVPERSLEVTITKRTLTFYTDNTKATKKSCDAIFDEWTDESHVSKLVTRKKLLYATPKKDHAMVIYDFWTYAGGKQRVTFYITNYRKTTKKAEKEVYRSRRR